MTEQAPSGPLDSRLTTAQVREELSRNEPQKSGESPCKEWFELLIRAGFWAFMIYQFVFQVSVVKGVSMMPNFEEQDRLLIDKLTLLFRDPRPGDVVVFDAVVRETDYGAPFEPGRKYAYSLYRDYIKRIIAVPGDRVKIFDGQVHVNGKAISEPWGSEPFVRFDEISPETSRTREYLVPKDCYFVLGDRRGNSTDSREARIGFVPEKRIKGIVRCRFWPLDSWAFYGERPADRKNIKREE